MFAKRSTLNRLYFALLSVTILAQVSHAEASEEAAQTKAVNMISELITASNAAQFVQAGPDATGGIGDWVLSNGTLCVIIAGLENEGDFSTRGGTLRDIGLCGRDDDQFVSAQDLLNGSLKQPIDITDIRANSDPKGARITTIGNYKGWIVETQYSLSVDIADRLHMSKRIWRNDAEAADGGIFSTAILNYESMNPFLMSTTHPERTTGYKLEQFVGRSELAYPKAAKAVDLVVMTSPHDSAKPISYAWRRLAATRQKGEKTETLASYILADNSALAFVTLTEDLLIGDGSKLGLIQLLQVPFMDLALGDSISLEEEIWVLPSADIVATTNKLFPDAPLLSGQISGPNTTKRIHIDQADGTPITMVSADQDGNFSAHLPAGDYRLRILSDAATPVERNITVSDQDMALPTINLSGPAQISLPQGAPMRLAFRGIGDTPNPHFEDTLLDNIVNGEDGPITQHRVSDVHLSGSANDPSHIYLPGGNYKVYAVRGPEFSVETTDLNVLAGQKQELRIGTPKRIVTTPHHIAVDMHVHSGPSMDNAFSTRQRVQTFIAEHGEVMVAAEHDTIFDFNPLLREMGLSDKMVAITGSEVTSTVNSEIAPYTIGHMNFFPLTVSPHAHRRGLTNHEGKRTREVLYEMAEAHDHPIAQLNHARSEFTLAKKETPSDFAESINDEQFFDHMGVAAHPYNPHRPLTSAPNNSLIAPDPVTGARDIDFDVMEIMNGTQDHRPDRVAAARQDWLSLVAQGIKLAASANSDSHNKWQQVAMPRNMVRVVNDSLAAFDIDDTTSAIRSGAFYGTTGPFIDLSLGEARMGQTHRGKKAVLSGRIYAADWAQAQSLNIQINGKDIIQMTLDKAGTFSIPVKFEIDSFVTIEAKGKPSQIYKAVYPGFFPYAYSNPIYVDADSDGMWTPPGLMETSSANLGNSIK